MSQTPQSSPLTPESLRAALASSADTTDLVARLRAWFGADALRSGPAPKIEALTVAWALEAPGAQPSVVADDGSFTLPLARVGDSDVHAAVATLPSGTAMRWHYELGGADGGALLPQLAASFRTLYGAGGAPLEVYATHPDSIARPGVPQGTVTAQPPWRSAIYPGTTRDWWVYTPAQYRPDTPACVMVFQDAHFYKDDAPTVFDNLIAAGEMPVTVGIFLSPGALQGGTQMVSVEVPGLSRPPFPNAAQRQLEYDTRSDRYARFLLEEILPEVGRTLNLRQDAADRAIAGLSSGALCAFTAAWERPAAFGKVLSWIGSYTNIATFVEAAGDLAGGPEVRHIVGAANLRPSGHDYPALIRTTPPKPIRVFLQDGENDLETYYGHWWLANQQMARALAWAGYDHATAWGKGFHSPAHGRAILPDSLRWLWRGWRED